MNQLSLLERPRRNLLAALEPEPDDDGLRWYQCEAKACVLEALRESKDASALVVMATGLGKSVLIRSICCDWDGPILILAHRSELVEQMRNHVEMATGEYVEVEQAQLRCSANTRIVVGSVDTVKQKKRLERLGPDRFSLVIVDEAHHYVAKTFRRPLDYFNAPLLGVTATPDRADEKALGQIFAQRGESGAAYLMDIEDGIADGHLVPLRGRSVTIEEIDLDNVGTSAGDLAAGQLDEEMLKGVEGIVEKTLELEPDRQALAFFPGVQSAEYAAAAFNRRIPGSAAFIHGGTPPEERKYLVKEFKRGGFLYFCNCNILTEGFDAPGADLVIQARPTKSRSLYAQMVGRVTRPLPGLLDHLRDRDQAEMRRRIIEQSGKPYSTILDFVGNGTRHALVTVADVLGGNYEEDEIARAKKKLEKNPDQDPSEALKKARKELQAIKAKVSMKARVMDFDPFRLLNVGEGDSAIKMRFGDKPATDRQLEVLKGMKIPDDYLDGLTKRDASKLISKAFERRDRGLATYAQIKRLARYGVNATDLSMPRASEVLDYIASVGWVTGNIDPHRLDAIIHRKREPGEDG